MNEKRKFTPQEACQYYTLKMYTVQITMALERSRTPSKAHKAPAAPAPSEKVIHSTSCSYPQNRLLYKTNNLCITFWSWKQRCSKCRVSRGFALHYIKGRASLKIENRSLHRVCPYKIFTLLQKNNGFVCIIDTKAAMIGSLLESENKGSQFFKNQEFSIMLANKS
jgi:hypothetical protein